MAAAKHEIPPDVPYGAHPRRARWPLAVLLVIFVIWFGFLIWLAAKYPAR
jgi:hypothetical protein